MTDYSPAFEAFWKAYPKRNGQKRGKKPAFKVWQALNKSEQTTALADVEKRNRNRDGKRGQGRQQQQQQQEQKQ